MLVGSLGAISPETFEDVEDAATDCSTAPSTTQLDHFSRAASSTFGAAPASAHAGNAEDADYYTYQQFENYLSRLPKDDPRLCITQLGTSEQGRPIWRIIFDASNGELTPEEKRTMVVMARQHGDEWSSSYVLEGMMDYLLGRRESQPPDATLQSVTWIFYPMVNPDGTVARQRGNAKGLDLNRQWLPNGPSSEQPAEIRCVQRDLQEQSERRSIRAFGDHHGWYGDEHGGYRYGEDAGPSKVPDAAYREAKKDTELFTEHAPDVHTWKENGGQPGMARTELWRWKGWLGHTAEYDRVRSQDPEVLRRIGEGYTNAMREAICPVSFLDSKGEVITTSAPGEPLTLQVKDYDENKSPTTIETVLVEVRDEATGDRETIQLVETGPDTGIFRANLSTTRDSSSAGDGTLQTQGGSRVVSHYTDADHPDDESFAAVRMHPSKHRSIS